MNVTVFGAGYVGLVQGAILAEVGHHVVCVDVDQAKVDGLKQGVVPIYEPGLSPIILDCVAKKRLLFTTDAKSAVEHGDIVFIAVGTPPDEDGSADLKYVVKVAETIGEFANKETVVVTKSTVPVGTADKVRAALISTIDKNQNDLPMDPFAVISNPEFLKEGSAVSDCKRPDRIIIGGDDPVAIEKMRTLYAPFNRNHERIIVMDVRSAEMTKYAANCMLATKISFMNEMANIAEAVGADIEAVRIGIGSDPRIGFQFIYPGCGYGGSCFPKDVQALVRTSQAMGVNPRILSAVERVNVLQKSKLEQYIDNHYGFNVADQSLEGKIFAVWGLSFKPNTDDMRESPSLVLIRKLLDRGAKVQAYDPEAMNETRRIMGSAEGLSLMEDGEACLDGANALVLCTEWETFRSPDFRALKAALSDRLIVDGRNVYDPETVEKHGLCYYGIGRGRSVSKEI
jgi:UDPglucose 6-dehydrogenase